MLSSGGRLLVAGTSLSVFLMFWLVARSIARVPDERLRFPVTSIRLSAENGGGSQTIHVPVSNPTGKKISITSVVTSCGCTRTGFDTPCGLEPHERLSLAFRVSLPAVGQKTSQIVVKDDSGHEYKVSLVLTGFPRKIPSLDGSMQRIRLTASAPNAICREHLVFSIREKNAGAAFATGIVCESSGLRFDANVIAEKPELDGVVRHYRTEIVDTVGGGSLPFGEERLLVVDQSGRTTDIVPACLSRKLQNDLSVVPTVVVFSPRTGNHARLVIRSREKIIPDEIQVVGRNVELEVRVSRKKPKLMVVDLHLSNGLLQETGRAGAADSSIQIGVAGMIPVADVKAVISNH